MALGTREIFLFDFVERINFVVILLLTEPDGTGAVERLSLCRKRNPKRRDARERERERGGRERERESAVRAGGGYKPKTIAGARLLAPRVSMPYTP